MANIDPSIENWFKSQSSHKREKNISIVVPAYNEERRLPATLIDIIDFCEEEQMLYEIIVVDDGSTDLTHKVIEKFKRIRSEVRGIQLPKNYGKGHAVRTGALNADGVLILFTDADGATPIEELKRLLPEIINGADIAIGSRAIYNTETAVKTVWYRKAIGRVFNFLVNTFLIPNIADTQCGFKLFTRSAANFVFSRQKSDGFSFDLELLFLARKANLTVKEIGINWTNIPGSKVNLVVDSIKMFIDIFKCSIRHRNVNEDDYKNQEVKSSQLRQDK